MIFVKSVGIGIATVVLMWFAIVSAFLVQTYNLSKERGASGIQATAGGWNYLLQKPAVLVLLTVAFGVGLYVASRWFRS
jgi:hypothetical protein